MKKSRTDKTPASPAPPSGCEACSGWTQTDPASGLFHCAETGRGPLGSRRSTVRGHSTCSCIGSDRCSAGIPVKKTSDLSGTMALHRQKDLFVHEIQLQYDTIYSSNCLNSVYQRYALDGIMLPIISPFSYCNQLALQRESTCMPQTLTPSVAEVLCAHFLICLAAFSSEASSPCCLVPIFRSRMQG